MATTSRIHLVPPGAAIVFFAIVLALVVGGCAKHPHPKEASAPVVFPLPPEKPRVQYLGSISSTADLPQARSGFARFILGPVETQYPMAKPISAALHGNRLYICDTVFNTVLVYDLVTGEAHSLEGNRGSGRIQQPNNLTFDEEGRLYVADKVRGAVLVYNADESFAEAWGRPGETNPASVVVQGDELFVGDPDMHEIEVWSRQDGSFLRKFGGLGKEPGKFFIPTYLALDGQGHLFVTDTGNFRVQKLSLAGEPISVVGGPGRNLGKFAWPKGLAVDTHGRLFVVDSRFANVQIFDDQGRLLLYFGAPGPDGGNLDLPSSIEVFPWPSIPWFQSRLMPGFDPESLAIVVSQQGAGLINFFAIARDSDAGQ